MFYNLILTGNNNFKRILKKFKFKNNLTTEKFDEIDIDCLPRNSSLRSFLEFQQKERELSKLKNDLKKFTETLKNLDIVKNAQQHYEQTSGDGAGVEQEEGHDENKDESEEMNNIREEEEDKHLKED